MDATEDKPAILRKNPWDGVGMPAEDKNRTIYTPSFAFDWQHQWHWDDAINKLKMPAPAMPAATVQVTPG
jgi:hypothetical protein